ncbi:MAG: hypothetical protein HOP21_08890 [Methylotenera sp.]|nr:hypothetical protein [Methylotenera sp.]
MSDEKIKRGLPPNNIEKEETENQSESKQFGETDRAWLNFCLIGVLIIFWLSVYFNGLPVGLGGGKFLVFIHAAVLAGFYKVNKD